MRFVPIMAVAIIVLSCQAKFTANKRTESRGGVGAPGTTPPNNEGTSSQTGSETGSETDADPSAKLTLATCKDPDLTKVLEGTTLTLCNGKTGKGSLKVATPATCTEPGQTNCVVKTDYVSISPSDIDADQILVGYDIVGTAGTYAPDFASPANVRTTDTSDGVAGTLADCSDGDANCYAGAPMAAADTSTFDANDIKAESTIAGVAGGLRVDCRNHADLTVFDGADIASLTNDADGGADNGVIDPWDTIDDLRSPSPSGAPAAWSASNNCTQSANWTEHGADLGGSNGTCDDPADECVYQLVTSGTYWSEIINTPRSWAEAQQDCDGLNTTGFGGFNTGWRVPTQKEVLQAYLYGFALLQGPNYIADVADQVWTSTTTPGFTLNAWAARIGQGSIFGATKSDNTNYGVICVR